MIRAVERMADRLLVRLVPRASASATYCWTRACPSNPYSCWVQRCCSSPEAGHPEPVCGGCYRVC